MKEKDIYMLFHSNYRDYFEMLEPEQVKILMISLFDFMEDQDFVLESDDKLILMVFKMITDNTKVGMKKQLTSSINGKKGGRPKKNIEQKVSPTTKQINFCKLNEIKVSGLSKLEVSNLIEDHIKNKNNNYQEPEFLKADVVDEEVEIDLKGLIDGTYN